MMMGECDHISDVVLRSINEELGSLKLALNIVAQLDTMQKYNYEADSESYPGLKIRYNAYIIQVKIDNLPENEFTTTEYKKDMPTEIRLTTAWEWVEPKPENFSVPAVKDYLSKYFI